MSDQKPWYQSKGVWGGIIAALAGLSGMFGITVPEGEVMNITEAVTSLVTTIGGIVAIYGRIVAKSKIG